MEVLIAKNNRPEQISSDDDLINIIKAKKRK